jgi:hypothetical protein
MKKKWRVAQLVQCQGRGYKVIGIIIAIGNYGPASWAGQKHPGIHIRPLVSEGWDSDHIWYPEDEEEWYGLKALS